jgi:LEA14-like dessication related protein
MKFLLYLILPCICLLSACEMPKEPTFKKIQNLKFDGFGEGKINISGDALFNNPNAFGGTLTGTELDVFIDGEKSGHISQREQIAVPAQSDFSVPIRGALASQGLLGKALSFLTKKEMKARFNGYITIKALEVEFKVPVNYEQPIK